VLIDFYEHCGILITNNSADTSVYLILFHYFWRLKTLPRRRSRR